MGRLSPLLGLIPAAVVMGCGPSAQRGAAADASASEPPAADACAASACAPADATRDERAPSPEAPPSADGPGGAADTAALGPDAPSEVSPADASSESAPAGCAGLFCEDFESGALDPAKWAVTSGVNHVDDAAPPSVIASDRAAHGKYAAHFHGKGNVSNDDAFIVTKSLPPALLTHHFGRLYFYVATKPTSGHTQWILGGSAGMSATPKLRDFEVATINGGWQLGFDQLGMSPAGEEVFYPTGQVTVAKWTCLEWEFDDQPDSDTAWVDGRGLGTLDDQHINYPAGHVPGTPIFDGKSTGLVGGFTTYSFGFYDWHPNADFDLYFDDIVLDTQRVGCL
jgi:hypothetical protein